MAENGSQHGILGNVVAQDRDTMSQVGTACECHLHQGWSWRGQPTCATAQFSVLANGSVFINQGEAIDYEACDLVTLVVRAYDVTTDPRFQAYSDNE